MAISMRSVVLIFVGLGIVLGLGYVIFRTDPVPVDFAVVSNGPLQVTINADGRTRVRDLYEIASPIAGTALRSPVKVGDRVVANETVVAIVEPVTSVLLDERSRMQAEAALLEARANLHLAETEFQRAEKERAFEQAQVKRTQALVASGVSSLTALETASQVLAIAEAAVRAAQARIELAYGQIERAEATLIEPGILDQSGGRCCIEIRAPGDGVVLSIDTISSRPVSPGMPLLTIGDPAELELVADILSTDGVRLSPGASAIVERWGGIGSLEARLERIDPAARTKVSALGIEEQRIDVVLSLVTPPEDRMGLGQGFSVFVRIIEWESEAVLTLPVSALFRHAENWAVFVAEGSAASLRIIEVGHRSTQSAEVLSGVVEGDAVITHPSDRIFDGVTIIQREDLK